MDASDWDRRYAATELLWSAEPNRFVDAELANRAERVRRPVVDAEREAIDTLGRAHRPAA
ncbi:hypothetical protein ABGB07_00155 [Micromonosporaceae bacterium B7E4]